MYSLEGDGVCEHLYEFVWCKDELSFRPTLNIPDTVVYKFGQPVSWFFTGVDGRVKKKLKTNIINAKIEEAFVKANVGSDIIAYYVSWASDASKYSDGALWNDRYRDYKSNSIESGTIENKCDAVIGLRPRRGTGWTAFDSSRI